jgi:UDP-glucose 4-epimerase
MAERSPGRPLTEADPPHPEDDYGRSKLAAEESLLALAGPMEVVCLRPPLVYGPGVGANFRALIAAVARGVPLPFGSLRNRRSLIALDNLADAVAVAIAAEGAAGRYLVCGQPAQSTAELVRALAAALDRPARLVAVPPALLRALSALPVLGPRLDRLTGDLEIDDALFRTRFGWVPPVAAADALRATAGWYRRRRR